MVPEGCAVLSFGRLTLPGSAGGASDTRVLATSAALGDAWAWHRATVSTQWVEFLTRRAEITPCAGAKGAGGRAGEKGKARTPNRTGGRKFYYALQKKMEQNEQIVIDEDAVIVVCQTCYLVHYSVPGKKKHQHSDCAGPTKHRTSHLRGCDCVPDAGLPSACTWRCAHR